MKKQTTKVLGELNCQRQRSGVKNWKLECAGTVGNIIIYPEPKADSDHSVTEQSTMEDKETDKPQISETPCICLLLVDVE